MKSYCLVLFGLLLCFVIAAFAQDGAIGEEPANDFPTEQPTSFPTEGDESQEDPDVRMCVAMAQQCPDGTWATQDANCHFICGSAPVGNLTYDEVEMIMDQFLDAYPTVMGTSISTLIDEDFGIDIQPPESPYDYCIEALVADQSHLGLPDVFQGVRVWYVQSTPYCSPIVCADGTVVGCYDVCEDKNFVDSSSAFFTPITVIVVVVVLSACCCCLRRRKCRAKCQMKGVPVAAQPYVPQEQRYPAEQYVLLQQQQQEQLEQEQAHAYAIPMHPVYPPMPMFPPQMMVPNGQYIMVQAPNGMWYPVVAPQHEAL